MTRRLFLFLGLLAAVAGSAPLQARLKVATTHPLISDLARQVGGERVDVVDLMAAGSDVHHFEPTARELAQAKGAAVLLASGKGLESFLPKLRDTFPGARLVEVGRAVPSLKLDPRHALFLCCPGHDDHGHSHDGLDPHWWHSADNMARAAKIIAEEFAEADAAGAADYRERARAAEKRLKELKLWAKKELARIPKERRKLVTAHAAFSYFCQEHGFQSLPLLGLGAEEDYSPRYVAEATQLIRKHGIPCVFPEAGANHKVLQEIIRTTGVRVGPPLIADGTGAGDGSTFEGMLRHNVGAIVSGLAPHGR